MEIISVSIPRYSNAERTQINCIVECQYGTLPFTARADDPMDYGKKLYNDLKAGRYGAVAEY